MQKDSQILQLFVSFGFPNLRVDIEFASGCSRFANCER